MPEAATHPLWRPFDPAAIASRASARLARRQIDVPGLRAPRDWSSEFAVLRELVISTLGSAEIIIDHIGSTAVPDLWAKPILDLDLKVPDSRAESTYLPALERVGFRLVAREQEWEEHRFLTFSTPNTNLHVFSPGAVEPRRSMNTHRAHSADPWARHAPHPHHTERWRTAPKPVG